jgi:hypothetical protein
MVKKKPKKPKKKSKLQKKIENVSSRLWRNKADKVWKELIFIICGGKCIVCGSTEFIQAHHLIPREVLLFRHHTKNGICLCPSHHKYSFLLSPHKNPVRFLLWLKHNDPSRWEWLCRTFNPVDGIELGDGHPEVDFKKVYELLQKELAARGQCEKIPETNGG